MIYLLFDNDHKEPVATEKEWHRLGAWGSQVSAPELHKLLETARSDNLPALTEQIAAARMKWRPDADVDETLVKALSILEAVPEVNEVFVTDGGQAEPTVQEIVTKAIQQHHEQLTLQFGSIVADLTKQVQEFVAKPTPVPPPQQFTLAIPPVDMQFPPDAEVHHKGAFAAVTKAITDGIAQLKVHVQNKNEVAAPIVKLADARPLIVPELQTLVRLVESLVTAQIAMVQAIQDFTRAKKPVVRSIEMEKDKSGKWCAKVTSE